LAAGSVNAHDLAWVKSNRANVPAIMRRHGGEFLTISGRIVRLAGTGPGPDRAALMTFPSLGGGGAFVIDPDYAPYRAVRRAPRSVTHSRLPLRER
jgi:uncharacterized protein (DUF1330 family)